MVYFFLLVLYITHNAIYILVKSNTSETCIFNVLQGWYFHQALNELIVSLVVFLQAKSSDDDTSDDSSVYELMGNTGKSQHT